MSLVRFAIWMFAVVSPLRVLNHPATMSVLAGPALARSDTRKPNPVGSEMESPAGSLKARPLHGAGVVSSTATAGLAEPATTVVVIAARASNGIRRVMGVRTRNGPETRSYRRRHVTAIQRPGIRVR